MREHVVDTWRPVGSVRQQLHSFFVGGGPQLRDLTYVRQPSDWAGPVLSKYGFRTQPAGQVKIRTSSMLHKRWGIGASNLSQQASHGFLVRLLDA